MVAVASSFGAHLDLVSSASGADLLVVCSLTEAQAGATARLHCKPTLDYCFFIKHFARYHPLRRFLTPPW